MNYTDRKNYACYDSDFLALTFRLKDASLAFLGLDSGGRSKERKNTYDLLKPSYGAHAAVFTSKATAPTSVSHDKTGLSAKGAKGSLKFAPVDDRSFTISVAATKGSTLPRGFFRASFAIAIAPPTVWAQTDWPDLKKTYNVPEKKPGLHARKVWQLPMLVHFPDYGVLKVESADGTPMEALEELVESKEMAGLNLGYQNLGGHPPHVALHHGVSRMTFRTKTATTSATLRFTVVDEISPKAPFLKEARWNGFRRAWLNNFPLNRSSMTMGDNIDLGGLAHLAVHNKADMLDLCDPADNPVFGRIRETFVRTLDTCFELCQASDGELSWDYFMRDKPDGMLMTAFIDCTPSNLISGLIALRWVPDRARKWLPALMRAADFLMGLDTNGDGLIEIPFGGTSFGEPWPHKGGRPRIWWDNIAFGHQDAWYNMLAHRGIRLLAERLHLEGMANQAVKYEEFLAKCDAAFRPTLFNPESGVIAGWRDSNGRLHDYHFTFPTAMAVNEGVIKGADARAMLKRLLRYMKEAGFGDNRFGIPGNTLPIGLGEDTFDWAFMAAWPRYENGGCCGMTAWHFLNALYRAGLEKEADDIYFRMLETFDTMPTHSGLFPAYMESCDWRTKDGISCGYNYLADNYIFLGAGFIHHAKKEHPIFNFN